MAYEGRHRLSVAHLLAALVAMFVFQPFVDHMAYGYLIGSVFFTIVLLSAINAVGGQRRTQIAAAMLAAPAVGAGWLQHLWPDSLLDDFYLLSAFVFTEAADANAKLAGFKALYFSVQIITTTTFGDIMPVSNAARMLALVEATVGLFYLAILVSRLVGAYSGKSE